MYDPQVRRNLAHPLAAAFLAGAWSEPALLARARQALDPRPRWVRGVAREVLALYPRAPLDRPRELAGVVEVLLAGLPATADEPTPPRVRRWYLPATEMARARWPVPALPTVAALADFLALAHGELAWLADARGLERRAEPEALRNYRYGWVPRRGGPPRLLERPKARLKAAQRQVLRDILDAVEPHAAAHGFRRGHSAASHASLHVGQRVVLRADLEDFFASVPAGRVYGLLRVAGYPEGVAHALTALTTNVVPEAVWAALPRPVEPALLMAHHRLGRRLATPHLPQGAPTSPALANLCAFGLDRRLAGLAASVGARYSRYADDLALSGDEELLRRAPAVRAALAAIARDEGFRVNARKSQLMSRAGRQELCGIVVNERPNVTPAHYDQLKATLHDAARHGPAGANRAGVPDFRAHLLGRIAWVESLHPARGARLRASFAQIDWSAM